MRGLSGRKQLIWDPLLRMFHWLLAGAFFVAWFEVSESKIHEGAGKIVLSLLLFRLVWGLMGPESARFSNFVRSPAVVMTYVRDILTGQAFRFLGHNPAGGAMVVALLFMCAVTAISGLLMRTTFFWGNSVVEQIHGWSAYAVVGLVILHLLGVLLASLQHHELLPLSMIHGRKPDQFGMPVFLGATPPSFSRLIGTTLVAALAICLTWAALVLFDASAWRMHKIIAAKAQERGCEISVEKPVLQVYPNLRLVYEVNGSHRISVSPDAFLAKRPNVTFAELDQICLPQT